MRILFAALLLVIPPCTFGQPGSSDVSFVYGVWKVQRVREIGGHASASTQLAEKQVGREIHFHRKSMSYEAGLLYFNNSCRGAKYRIKKQKLGRHDVGEKGTLEFYGLGPKRRGWIETVIVKCGDSVEYYFERAEGEGLAIYYDGWFFFLEKVAR